MKINVEAVLKDLQRFMSDKKLTKAKLANSLGVSRQAVYGWFNGKTPQGPTIILIIAMMGRNPKEYQAFVND